MLCTLCCYNNMSYHPTMSSTCFSQWQEYIKTDTSDWRPHISRFRSLRRTATAAQIPGKCEAPTFLTFLRSLKETNVSRVWRSVGALDFNSLIKLSQLLLANAVTDIRLNRDVLSDVLHRLLHSWDRTFRRWVNTASCNRSDFIMASAIVGAWPDIRLSAMFPSDSPRVVDMVAWDGDVSVT